MAEPQDRSNECGERKLVGFLNQGATCYLNSLLQTLFLTPEFRRGLYSLVVHSSSSRNIPLQLQKLFARLQYFQHFRNAEDILDHARAPAISTEALTDAFGWQGGEAYQQHDVSELNRILLDSIQRALAACTRGPTGKRLVDDLFAGSQVHQLRCCSCGYVSERKESMLDLSVAVEGFASLEDSLRHYLAVEHLTGDNRWRCGGCLQKVDAQRRVCLTAAPPILTLCLMRFTYNMKTLKRQKINQHFAFSLQLNMAPFLNISEVAAASVEPNGDAGTFARSQFDYDGFLYDLASVVIHSGVGAEQGHYHAYIRDFMHEGCWNQAEAECVLYQSRCFVSFALG